MKKYRIIIAGGRDFTDWGLLRTKVSYYILMMPPSEVEIVSGCCEGADQLGEEYAMLYCYPVKEFPADWKKHGNAAGLIRNREMAEYATHLILFWDGKSKGSKDMLQAGKDARLKIKIVNY